MHFLVTYEKAPDYAEREPAHQAAHRRHVWEAVDRGELILGGPLLEPADGTNLLLFRAHSVQVVEAFATADPYVREGIVRRWSVRPWQTVVGDGAEPMTRPAKNPS